MGIQRVDWSDTGHWKQANQNKPDGAALTEEDQAILEAYTKQLLGDREAQQAGKNKMNDQAILNTLLRKNLNVFIRKTFDTVRRVIPTVAIGICRPLLIT